MTTGAALTVAADSIKGRPAAHSDCVVLATCAASATLSGLRRAIRQVDVRLLRRKTLPRPSGITSPPHRSRLVDRVCELQALMREGQAAWACSLALWDAELIKPGKVYTNDRLTAAIVRDLLAGSAAA